MSFFTVAAAVVAVGASAYTAVSAGQATAKQADAASYQGILGREMADLDATRVETQTADQVIQIKKQAMIFRGTQIAQQAASGVIVGDGSAGQMLDQAEQLSNEDVLATMYSGANKAVSIRSGAALQEDASKRQASLLMEKAAAERTSAYLNVASSVAKLGATSYNAFKPKT